jgi:hypothetical protein
VIFTYEIEIEDLNQFLNSNIIVGLRAMNLLHQLPLSIFETVTLINCPKILNLEKFKKLQRIYTYSKPEFISYVIPLLASKFTENHFKKIIVEIEISKSSAFHYNFGEWNLKEDHKINPKSVLISCFNS